ncbi:MAG: NADH-quinone oxidoreductase subunit M [Gammaproteobacteria bacterium]|nr:NADH-quinone oxidoreductase subunit M [Gammaproteobacteria bacterium]
MMAGYLGIFGDWPLLSLLIISLPVGALLIWIAPGDHHARYIALATAMLDLLLSLTVAASFDTGTAVMQLTESIAWIPTLNVHYSLGVDGLSVLFLPLTIILFIGVILVGWNSIHAMPRLYYTLMLVLESTTIGVFCATDTILFFLFWELTLVPLYFLVSLWGIGPNRRFAAGKYFMYMLAGGIPMLFAFIMLAFNHADVTGSGLGFDYVTLLGTKMPEHMQIMVFVLLLLGFGVKTPIFPLHSWLPIVTMEGPVSVAALVTGLKLGAFGLMKFAIPLAPDAARSLHWLLAGVGTIALLYGALAALRQSNIRQMLAYASFSHVGLVVLGLSSLNQQGLQGAIFQLLNFTLIGGGLFLLTGMLHQRLGSTEIIHLGGLAKRLPVLATFFFILTLAALGIPGTSGFPAELLLVLGVLQVHTGAGLAVLVTAVLAAAYALGQYRQVFFGPLTNTSMNDVEDLVPREKLVILVFIIIVIFGGIMPTTVLQFTETASTAWMTHLQQAMQ